MATGDSSKIESSGLSPDAKAFVPASSVSYPAQSSTNGLEIAHPQGQLPAYIINCYPVQSNTHSALTAARPWLSSTQGHQPVSPYGVWPVQGLSVPPFYHPSAVSLAVPPRQAYWQPSMMTAPVTHFPPPGQAHIINQRFPNRLMEPCPQLQVRGPTQLLTTPRKTKSEISGTASAAFSVSASTSVTSLSHKNSVEQRAPSPRSAVGSIKIEGNKRVSRARARKRGWRHMNIQTDFPAEIADKTLLEFPSFIYTEYQSQNLNFNDHDVVDSDSGYCSPFTKNSASFAVNFQPMSRNSRVEDPISMSEDIKVGVCSSKSQTDSTCNAGGSVYTTSSMGDGGPGRSYSCILSQAQVSCVQNLPDSSAVASWWNANAALLENSDNTDVIAGGKSDISLSHRNNSHDLRGKSVDRVVEEMVEASSSKKKKQRKRSRSKRSKSEERMEIDLAQSSQDFPALSSQTARSNSLKSGELKGILRKKPVQDSKFSDRSSTTPENSCRNSSERDVHNTSSSQQAADEKPKKHRHRSRRRSSMSTTEVNDKTTLDLANNPAFAFDANEFPSLLSAMNQIADTFSSAQPISYSDVASGAALSRRSLSRESLASAGSSTGGLSTADSKTSAGSEGKSKKRKRTRRNKKVLLNDSENNVRGTSQTRDSENEGSKQDGTKSPKSSKKRTQQPVLLDIAEIISVSEKQKAKQKEEPGKSAKKRDGSAGSKAANPLDASAPAKRGKERETPKPKRQSTLKKVILKEREDKLRLQLLNQGVYTGSMSQLDTVSAQLDMVQQMDMVQLPQLDMVEQMDTVQLPQTDDELQKENEVEDEQQLVENGPTVEDKNSDSLDFTPSHSTSFSPISQQSPLAVTPLSSPHHSGFVSPVVQREFYGEGLKATVLQKIHSRKFREYCNQRLDPEIDACATALLQTLQKYQERQYHKVDKDPNKMRTKRRLVLGLREVTKHLKLKKIKCVIISPNLERIQSKGGLDEAIYSVIALCQEQHVPFVFALSRRTLGRACSKLVPVSMVGIFNYDGCDDKFRNLMELSEKARAEYEMMVKQTELEVEEECRLHGVPVTTLASMHHTTGSDGILPRIYAHLGHSRTSSACSAISLGSSLLSEPISEIDPEENGDVKRDINSSSSDRATVSSPENSDTAGKVHDHVTGTTAAAFGLMDIDEGHEADTEEDFTSRPVNFTHTNGHLSPPLNSSVEEEDCKHDSLDNLPTFDTVHDNKLLKMNSAGAETKSSDFGGLEVQSTHSSKTLEDGSSALASAPVDGKLPLVQEEVNEELHYHRVDSDRIESWVADTQKQIEQLQLTANSNEEDVSDNQLTPRTEETNEHTAVKHNVCDELIQSSGLTPTSIVLT